MKKKQILIFSSSHPLYDLLKEQLGDVIKAFPKKEEPSKEPPIQKFKGLYITRLAEKLGWKPVKMAGFLDSLYKLSPSATFSLLLREIAIELDKKYEDHINKCETLYIISMFDGRIHKVPRAYIKNFRNFAAFRTEEDAKEACSILRNELKAMFASDGKQKD